MELNGVSRNLGDSRYQLLQPYGGAETMAASITGLSAFVESELDSGNRAPYIVRISK